jgi:hypothetical protein
MLSNERAQWALCSSGFAVCRLCRGSASVAAFGVAATPEFEFASWYWQDTSRMAFGCSDGTVTVWDLASNTAREIGLVRARSRSLGFLLLERQTLAPPFLTFLYFVLARCPLCPLFASFACICCCFVWPLLSLSENRHLTDWCCLRVCVAAQRPGDVHGAARSVPVHRQPGTPALISSFATLLALPHCWLCLVQRGFGM